MDGISFKDKDEKCVKKVNKKEIVQNKGKNNEGNVAKARKVHKVVNTNVEEPMCIHVWTSPSVLYSRMHYLSE